jgi:hypothetical protein
VKKKPIKSNKILKKPTGSVRFGFGFISLKPKKPNQTQTKKKNWKKNRVKPEKTKPKPKKPSQTGFYPKNPNRTETDRFKLILVFLKKIQFNYFFYKN